MSQSIDSSGLLVDNEMISLQFAAFLLSVCHIVLLVQDWFFDPNILKYYSSLLKNQKVSYFSVSIVLEYYKLLKC